MLQSKCEVSLSEPEGAWRTTIKTNTYECTGRMTDWWCYHSYEEVCFCSLKANTKVLYSLTRNTRRLIINLVYSCYGPVKSLWEKVYCPSCRWAKAHLRITVITPLVARPWLVLWQADQLNKLEIFLYIYRKNNLIVNSIVTQTIEIFNFRSSYAVSHYLD